MDENHQDKTGSMATAVEDATWVFNRKSRLWVPKHSKSGWLRRGFKDKTSWDWLQLLLQLLSALALPVALFLGAQWFSTQQSQASLQIAADQQQESTLVTYQKDMTDLLLTNHLRSSKEGDETQIIARVKTLTAVRRLDPDRKGLLIQFLYEAKLIIGERPLIQLAGADLSGANLSMLVLKGANLNEVNLRNANLFASDLTNAYIENADLNSINLRSAYLFDAHLTRTGLYNADLRFAHLSSSNLTMAYLEGANMHGANLSYAELFLASLRGADLSETLLCNTKIDDAQLHEAKSLQGAIMSNDSGCNI